MTVSIPPFIAEGRLEVDAGTSTAMDLAIREITLLDGAHGQVLGALKGLLLRTESIASSKIEEVEAGIDDYARALHGSRANDSAVAMVAATRALDLLVDSVGTGAPLRREAITDAHRALMRNDPTEARCAGRIRDVQNWIGGSDWSPRNALFVPPPPDMVDVLMDDLMAFIQRDDLPALFQAAVAHAQFESIHPFTDGNGRIGRALINTVFRRRGVTRAVVVPLASALVADRERYFGLLEEYRRGEVQPLVLAFTHGARTAAAESRVTAERLVTLPGEWREMTGPVRTGSAAARLLELLPLRPVLAAEDACAAVGGARSSVFAALDRLHRQGVLRPLTDRRRDQVWGAAAVLDELQDLGARIEQASR
ncbi:Fic family protein [Nakamurella flavida]|uniref:Fic family protein n=1 Tax=Nakamurella flavida TaxID=363630 RepID=UPI001962348C|nr:Fic family protein [Nakamurella flavida]